MTQMLDSALEHFYRIEKFMESMSDLDKLLQVIMGEASAATNAESSSLALYDEGARELHFYAASGVGGEGEVEQKLKSVRMPMSAGVIGWCATNREVVNIEDAYSDARFSQEADKATGFVTRSLLAVPMIQRGKLIGVVEAVNKRVRKKFSDHDEKVLGTIAAQAGLVLENSRLHEENLRQARLTALGQGIAGAAHCIKNILNGVHSGAYILDLGVKKQKIESVAKGWDIMKRNTQIMEDLVLDMLTYSRPRKPEIKPADINQVCSDIVALMKDKAAEKSVELVQALQPDIGEIVLDPKAIYRCVLNLVGNAVDASNKPDSRVELGTQATEDEAKLKIWVKDNGQGISEENLKNLFKVFFSTKGSKGTGLGLAVTHKIIGEHGGEITAESELDVGTTFTITLPLERPSAEAQE